MFKERVWTDYISFPSLSVDKFYHPLFDNHSESAEMNMDLRCMPCFIKQFTRELEGSSLSLDGQERVIRDMLDLLSNMTYDKPPVDVSLIMHDRMVELVDTMLESGGIEYYFSHWNANASGADNPLQINVTSSRYIEVQYDTQDITSPFADAGVDQVVNEDTVVTLDGSASTDNVGITQYTWTLLDESIQTLTGIAPNYTFTTTGEYEDSD